MGLGGISHWIIVLVIVLLLFGVGRISGVMGELGKGLKSFKQGLADDEEEKKQRYEEQRRVDSRPIDVTPEPRRTEDPAARPADDR